MRKLKLGRWRLALKAALTLAVSFSPLSSAWAAPPADLDIFLLFGQSNMSGRAELAGAPDFIYRDRLWMLRDGAFIPAREPVSDDPEAAFGPSLAFADALFRETRRPIGLVNCARGGTKIVQWAPDDTPDSLYGRCVGQVKQALALGRLRGGIFYQGEYDSWTLEDARGWSARATLMLQRLRKDLNAPSLPIIVTRIGPNPPEAEKASPARVLMAAQEAISLPHAAVVSAGDLPFQSDRLHLDQQGQLTLGGRYARTMWRLLQDARSLLSPRPPG